MSITKVAPYNGGRLKILEKGGVPMKMNALVLGVSRYSITDEKSGEVNRGNTVNYILSETLAQNEDKVLGQKGYRPARNSVPYENYDDFTVVPGLYELTFSQKIDSKGKVNVVPTEFRLISGIVVSKTGSSAVKPKAGTKDDE